MDKRYNFKNFIPVLIVIYTSPFWLARLPAYEAFFRWNLYSSAHILILILTGAWSVALVFAHYYIRLNSILRKIAFPFSIILLLFAVFASYTAIKRMLAITIDLSLAKLLLWASTRSVALVFSGILFHCARKLPHLPYGSKFGIVRKLSMHDDICWLDTQKSYARISLVIAVSLCLATMLVWSLLPTVILIVIWWPLCLLKAKMIYRSNKIFPAKSNMSTDVL